jgi:hypothetical protein
VKPGAQTSLTIQLSLDTKSLNEVVVTGVGAATSKRHLGIAVETVSADKLPAAPTASIDQALVGMIPGAQISSISGNPGDHPAAWNQYRSGRYQTPDPAGRY